MEYKPSKLPQFLGAVQDKFDERDFSFGAVVVPVEIPSWETGFDCEDKFGKLRDDAQFSTYGCVSFGGTNDLEETYLANGVPIQLSQRDAYSQIFLGGGGAQPRDFYKLVNKQGICEDSFLPTYMNGQLTETSLRYRGDITPEAIKNALEHKIDSYYSIEPNDWDLVRQAIFQNAGCGSGFRGVNASMGHFIFLSGWQMSGKYKALRYKDSYSPFKKIIIEKNGKYYLENENGAEVILFSIWTAIRNFKQNNNMPKLIRKKNTEKVYLETGRGRYWITNPEVFNDFRDNALIPDWNKIEEIDEFTSSVIGIIGDASISQMLKYYFGGIK